tara:strand:- start:670943 stop:671302 length:360 start_codon:yes stop_codon:yes gene_type:complete
MSNPFAVTTSQIDERGVFGDHARRIRGGFLYRVIELDRPYRCRLTYNGRWFVQRIKFDSYSAWRQISWLTIRPRAEFRVPAAIDASQPVARIEIGFTRGLMMRRFRVWIDGAIVYDEVN